MATNNKIFRWQGDTTQPYEDFFYWKSKTYLLPVRTTFGVARVIATTGDREAFYQTLATRNDTIRRNNERLSLDNVGGAIGENVIGDGSFEIGGDSQEEVAAEPSYSGDFDLSVNFYADGVLKFTKQVYASNVPFRLNDGYRGRSFEIEVFGNVTVRRIDMASSMRELQKVMAQEG